MRLWDKRAADWLVGDRIFKCDSFFECSFTTVSLDRNLDLIEDSEAESKEAELREYQSSGSSDDNQPSSLSTVR